jgi:hypothetical protein
MAAVAGILRVPEAITLTALTKTAPDTVLEVDLPVPAAVQAVAPPLVLMAAAELAAIPELVVTCVACL